MKTLAATPFDDTTFHLDTVRTKTVRSCRTEQEWLAAARHRSTRAANCVICSGARLQDVLASICADNAGEPACADLASRDAGFAPAGST